MRNTAEYEVYLTNPLEDHYPEEVTPTCDECGEPHDEQEWCGECGCCRACCKNEYVGCLPESMKPMTLTIYLHVDEKENPDKWNIGEMFDGVHVLAWKWQDGHHRCQSCDYPLLQEEEHFELGFGEPGPLCNDC